MKEKLFYHQKLYLGVFVCLFIGLHATNAQSIKRQSIASYGSSGATEGILFHQSIAQPYQTSAVYGGGVAILPGFQQPVSLKVEKLIPGNNLGLSLKVFPNPATIAVTIQSEKLIPSSLINVVDINGKIIWSEEVNDLVSYTLNCVSWKEGVYFLKVFAGDVNVSSSKLIIQK